MFRGKTILVAPLDWGLGHAARCVPLIRRLLPENRVIIGCTIGNKHFFSQYFPTVDTVELPSYNISYSAKMPQWLKVVLQLPGIFRQVKKEHRVVTDIISDLKIDVLISDNRYGVYSNNVLSVFISHQLMITTPFFTSIISGLQRRYLKRFDELWVPDHEDLNSSLAGELSHPMNYGLNCKYIGPQSAIAECETIHTAKYDFLLLLSGTEPQRGILEKRLLTAFSRNKLRVALVRGVVANSPLKAAACETVVDLATGSLLKSLILNSRTVICRSGYSTLMDVHLLDAKKLVLIPTPGQPEQEYLAKWWREKRHAVVLAQKDIPDFDFNSQNSFTP